MQVAYPNWGSPYAAGRSSCRLFGFDLAHELFKVVGAFTTQEAYGP
jgi:hypothetical protein